MARDWVVLKFGGTSVSTVERWQTIAGVLQERLDEGVRPFVVCSAITRISRTLEKLVHDAVAGQGAPVLQTIKARHHELGDSLGVDTGAILHDYFEELERLSLGASLTHEASPQLQARVLAMGELMLTELGAAYLRQQGLRTQWLDARTMLRTVEEPRTPAHRRYLFALCDYAPDPALQQRLGEADADIFLSQGFIAGNRQGETALVGWGGSDTSAAYFSSKLEAQRLEIWTDVPGMFTANPHNIPPARLLRALSYDEAQELASTGAEVLHPRCLDPVRQRRVPLHIRCTLAPQMEGTVIAHDVPAFGALVKAISARKGVTLIAMETPRMWQQVGFLARAFAAFERHDFSIDLVATGETSVTVSIDTLRGQYDPEAIDALLAELRGFCEARQIGPCAAVSLVGRNLRSILHELGPALEVLDEQHVHLVTQDASDLNFTFVVDEGQGERLVRSLHDQFFRSRHADLLFGPTWRELFEEEASLVGAEAWWRARRDDLLAVAEEASPRYVYDETSLREAADRLSGIASVERVFYAMKANAQADVLRVFYEAGLGFECVSPGEIERVRSLFPDLEAGRLLFTPNFAPRAEYAAAFDAGAVVTVDSLYAIETWPEVFAGQEIIVRVDPGRGHGHHKHVRTAGAQSKFGVPPEAMGRLAVAAERAGARIMGLHAHVGSGIRRAETWAETAVFLASLAEHLPDVRLLNLGGGFGVPEHPGEAPLDVEALARDLETFKRANPAYALWLESGRYLVAEAGVLLARVTQVKRKDHVTYVGIETGMNSLIRPALYGAYHEIVNLTKLDAPMAVTAEVVGPICETGDFLGHGRRLPETEEGDVLLIATTGAYGRTMSSTYNLRPPAEEVLLQAERVEA